MASQLLQWAAIYDEYVTTWKAFSDISIKHCYREANQVAHDLACWDRIVKENCFWIVESPRFLLGALINYVTILSNQ